MNLKTITNGGKIALKDYQDEECMMIFREAEAYVLKCARNYGEDYGGSQNREDCDTSYEEIIPERILVKNGHFAGVAILTSYDYYNGGGKVFYEEKVLLIDDSQRESARFGYSFSNDDHDRWDYTDFYLVEREE